jgi:hypothetical protein
MSYCKATALWRQRLRAGEGWRAPDDATVAPATILRRNGLEGLVAGEKRRKWGDLARFFIS